MRPHNANVRDRLFSVSHELLVSPSGCYSQRHGGGFNMILICVACISAV
uniref:Uncharacterized protein n=1 Tax=mine drainage metagenome TaxID=410659 RepID=E6PXF4_9ZZZZ